MTEWNHRSFEDQLLFEYWSKVQGQLYLEVPIGNKEMGNWPAGSKIRRIDAVRIVDTDETNTSAAHQYGSQGV